MPKKQWTDEERKAFGDKMRALRAEKEQKQTPQTDKVAPTEPSVEAAPAVETPAAPAPAAVTLTTEQLQALVAALSQGTTNTAPAPAFSGQSVNAQGQVVGSIIKFPVDPGYYPDPIPAINDFMETDKRTRRLAFTENYYLDWEWDAKPYDTKYGTSMREPTFHATLYANYYDDEGNDTGKFRVVQSLHFNEDESTALDYAHSLGIDATHENMREVMNTARVERLKRWLLSVFFPERNYELAVQSNEEAIDGQVVKIVTKSNVKGFGNARPVIDVEELQ